MTIDERILFLVQSTESLHATVQELSSNSARHNEQIDRHSKQIEALTRAIELDAENIRRLAHIAAAHEERLDGLEGETGGAG